MNIPNNNDIETNLSVVIVATSSFGILETIKSKSINILCCNFFLSY